MEVMFGLLQNLNVFLGTDVLENLPVNFILLIEDLHKPGIVQQSTTVGGMQLFVKFY